MPLALADIQACLEGGVPGALTTVAADGTPNIMHVSKVTPVDDRHLALTRQFFRKTAANLAGNPRASLILTEPSSFDLYQLELRHLRSETSGPLFDALKTELDAIASLMGMTEVFALEAAEIFEVEHIEHLAEATSDEPVP